MKPTTFSIFTIGALLAVILLSYLPSPAPTQPKILTKIEMQPTPRVDYKVTAYCPKVCCCGKYADGITASGHIIKPGDKFVAAPPFIPFGTIIDIPGYGKVPVEDRGRLIMSNTLDVFFPTHQEALNWDVKYLAVRFEETSED